MSEFEEASHKIKKIWDKTSINEDQLEKLPSTIPNMFVKGNRIKPQIVLEESDWRTRSLDNRHNLRPYSPIKNSKTYVNDTIVMGTTIEIPEYLIPYVNVDILFKTSSDKDKIKPIAGPFDWKEYEPDFVRYYNYFNKLVYEGPELWRLSHSRTGVRGIFSESFAKKFPYINKGWVSRYSAHGNHYYDTFFDIGFREYEEWRSWKSNPFSWWIPVPPCIDWRCSYDESEHNSYIPQEIINISSTSITAKWKVFTTHITPYNTETFVGSTIKTFTKPYIDFPWEYEECPRDDTDYMGLTYFGHQHIICHWLEIPPDSKQKGYFISYYGDVLWPIGEPVEFDWCLAASGPHHIPPYLDYKIGGHRIVKNPGRHPFIVSRDTSRIPYNPMLPQKKDKGRKIMSSFKYREGDLSPIYLTPQLDYCCKVKISKEDERDRFYIKKEKNIIIETQADEDDVPDYYYRSSPVEIQYKFLVTLTNPLHYSQLKEYKRNE